MTGADDTLQLVARLARRGANDLDALVCAATSEADVDAVSGLVRAGLMRGGERPRVPARLLLPALALHAAVGLRDDEVLTGLAELLLGAQTAGAREQLLAAVADELKDQQAKLSEGKADTGRLREALGVLDEALGQLHAVHDPADVTRVAALCARVIETLARQMTPKRAAPKPRKLPGIGFEQLAAACADLVVCAPRVVRMPAAASLAAALLPPQAPAAAPQREARLEGAEAGRREAVLAALAAPDANAALYGHVKATEAMARHAAVIALGRDPLHAAGWLPGHLRRPGPGELAWSTALDAVAAERLAA